VQVELVRRQDGVGVRAEAEEGDVAEVEQPGVADDDVQAEREQREHERVEADADDVVRVGQVREDRREHAHDEQRLPERQRLETVEQLAGEAGAPLAPPFDARDPLVRADARLAGGV